MEGRSQPEQGHDRQRLAARVVRLAEVLYGGRHRDQPGFTSRTLIERWEGHGWYVLPSENPAPANQVVGLWSVDCVSSTLCIAGGRARPAR